MKRMKLKNRERDRKGGGKDNEKPSPNRWSGAQDDLGGEGKRKREYDDSLIQKMKTLFKKILVYLNYHVFLNW
jgi:hypothetical protein